MLPAVLAGVLFVVLKAVNAAPSHDALTRQARGQR
jgi:hypothetical protein